VDREGKTKKKGRIRVEKMEKLLNVLWYITFDGKWTDGHLLKDFIWFSN